MNTTLKKKGLSVALGLLFVSALYAQQVPQHIAAQLKNTKQGEIVRLDNFLTESFTKINYDKVIWPGPQYMISDDPEYIRIPEGIALKEKVEPGTVRLYVYNVNGVKEPKTDRKITAVIKNTGKGNMRLKMLKYSSQKPSANYFKVGKEGLYDYFNSQGLAKERVIKPGQTVAIDEVLERNVVRYDELVHGIYEFLIDEPGEVAVLQTAPGTSGPKAYETIGSVIPTNKKNAGRGMFGVSNYKVFNEAVLETDKGVTQLVVADGKDDAWVKGIEGESNTVSTLAGNYGVMYNIELKWKSNDGKGLALLTWNSRSDNQWCSAMAASVVVSDGVYKGGVVQLPAERLNTKGNPEAVLIQIFKPEQIGKEQILKLTYSPPGASCLPTPLVLVPIDLN
ncbi:copper amine oxidase [Sphingobacterium spiritivorum]|uniref:copper amine oxidase n=1 Tax=Sphingobacterium spiritivorum TaxID=258 RepID=UPI003DA4A23B